MANEKPTDQISGADKTAKAAETTQTNNQDKPSVANQTEKPISVVEASSDKPAGQPVDKSTDTTEKPVARRSQRRSGRSGRSSNTAGRSDASGRSDADRRPETSARTDAPNRSDSSADTKPSGRSNGSGRPETSARTDASNRSDSSSDAKSSGRSNASGRPDASKRRGTPKRTDVSASSASTPRMGGYSIRPTEPAKVSKPASRWTLRDYILQLSVVIIGIVVTFAGSAQIERWRQARQVKDTMQLVYEELKADREQLESICASLCYDQQGMELVSEQNMDYKRVPIDSLRKYQYILGQMRAFTPRTDALEVLKVSETATSVDDKQLLMEVMACYSWMVNFSGTVQTYNDQKLKSINHLFENGMNGVIGGADPVESWRTMMADPMCEAFIGTMRNFFGTDLVRGEAVAKVDTVLASLNDKYHFE